MACQRCQSNRIMNVTAKCSDTCGFSINSMESEGYVPEHIGIGGGDYVELSYCLNCGQIKGNFPLAESDLEKRISEKDFRDFYDNHFSEGHVVPKVVRRDPAQDAEYYGTSFKNFINNLIQMGGNMPSCDELWDDYLHMMKAYD